MKVKKIAKSDRDAIAAQCLEEIIFDRAAKQPKIPGWHKNENLYYSKKILTDDSRANVNLNEMQSFVTTFLSKINTPVNFQYKKGEEADLKKAKRMNAFKDLDAKKGNWKTKFKMAREQEILYGRYIFEYHADSAGNMYRSHLNNVDVYEFLIDPSVGGLALTVDDDGEAIDPFHLGRGNIIISRKRLEDGIESGRYLKSETNELLAGAGNRDDLSVEEAQKQNRYLTLTTRSRILFNPDLFKFWEWYTTYQGERYYVLITEQGGKAIRVLKLTDMFKSNMWPFFTAAAYPSLTEFWTPSPADGVREIILGKSKSINQMLDNGEAINRPMKAFNASKVKNPALLKHRNDGLIPFKEGVDLTKDLLVIPTPQIETAAKVYEILDGIVGTNSGVNDGTKGQSKEDKVGIYQGNQENSADRFALVADNEADALSRLGQLYYEGVKENMAGKVAIEMIGIDGVEYEEITKNDLIPSEKDFDIVVVAAGSEVHMQMVEKKDKLTFISNHKQDQNVNQKVLIEMEANIVGFEQDDIKRILDVDNYGDEELMSEAARDIQRIIQGETIEPNENANAAYSQKIVDYLRDHREDIKPKIADALFEYNKSLQPIIMKNLIKTVDKQLATEGIPSVSSQMSGGLPSPLKPSAPINQPVPTN